MNMGYFAASGFGDDVSGGIPMPGDPAYCASIGMQDDGAGNCIPSSGTLAAGSGCPPGYVSDGQGNCYQYTSPVNPTLTPTSVGTTPANPSTSGSFWGQVGTAAGGIGTTLMNIFKKPGAPPSSPLVPLAIAGAAAAGIYFAFIRKPRPA